MVLRMSVFIHIGSPKCASTTIQDLIARNRSTLESAGCATKTTDFAHALAKAFQKGLPNGPTEECREILRGISGSLVLSSENFLSLAARPEAIDAFLGLFGHHD